MPPSASGAGATIIIISAGYSACGRLQGDGKGRATAREGDGLLQRQQRGAGLAGKLAGWQQPCSSSSSSSSTAAAAQEGASAAYLLQLAAHYARLCLGGGGHRSHVLAHLFGLQQVGRGIAGGEGRGGDGLLGNLGWMELRRGGRQRWRARRTTAHLGDTCSSTHCRW